MSKAKELWSAATHWTSRITTGQIQRQSYQHASQTELRYLAPAPPAYGQIHDNNDTSYKPHGLSPGYENTTFIAPAEPVSRLRPGGPPKPRRRFTQGWRFGAINCAISATIVFFINLIATTWGSTHQGADGNILFDGDCDRVRKLNTWLHFLINLLSTVLLSASNYSMQCLSAPTRKEVDAAHAKGIWLDIGVPSVHNLWYISRRRLWLWILLGLSSLPLHLFYNSAVFASIQSYDYSVLTVSEGFVNSPDCVHCANITGMSVDKSLLIRLHSMAHNGELDRLSNTDCINAYASMIQSYRRSLLLVVEDDKVPGRNKTNRPGNGTDVYVHGAFSAASATIADQSLDMYGWICTDLNLNSDQNCATEVDRVKSNPSAWTQGKLPINHCLSERAPAHCKLRFTPQIAILVTVLNFAKAAIIYYLAFFVKDNPLMTMGDAVASFIEDPDPTTRNMCLLTIHEAKKYNSYFPVGPRPWDSKVYRWKDVTSHKRRTTTFFMYFFALLIVSILLGVGITALPDNRSLPALAKLGYGSIDPRTTISWELTGTASNVVVANLAQPILSFLYFSYNGLFTCMLLGLEWSQYGHRRKGLRVSGVPRGAQRSTYFLQLPYRFALPLMVLSGVLHWLVSQSIFVVAIDLYDEDGSPNTAQDTSADGWVTCGYSPIAIISVLVLGICMVIAGVGFGFIKYKPGINLAGTCSAAMSAACHGQDGVDGVEVTEERLKWGVVSRGFDGVGHCAFSMRQDIEFPEFGATYAGVREENIPHRRKIKTLAVENIDGTKDLDEI